MIHKVKFVSILAYFVLLSGACEPPFHQVGSYCLMINNMMTGTWNQMRGVCQSLGGDLVNLEDANKLHDISNYIKENGLTDVSYWVGGTDEGREGNWIWSSNNSTVRMGTPLWTSNFGDPNGGANENCAIISKFQAYYMMDDDCDFQYNGIICQPGISSDSSPISKKQESQQPRECPPSYVSIGSTCIFLEVGMFATWYEAKQVCESQGAHLLKIDDANLHGDVYDYIINIGITDYIWIDGNADTVQDLWVFHDGTFVKRGTPFWKVWSEGTQAPFSGYPYNNCVIIIFDFGYFLADYPCLDIHLFICQYDV